MVAKKYSQRNTRKPRALTRDTRQIGTSNLSRDRKLKALAPGKRISKKGNIYYENRKNRSDVKGRDTPCKVKKVVKKNNIKISNQEKLREDRIKAYKKKIEYKKDRLSYLADKTKIASNNAYKQSNKAVSMIPFGQPILVGHHSERTHRNAIKRSDNAMKKSIELSDKAAKYEASLRAMENNYAIYSDDPEAIVKLKKKALLLEKKREHIKELNKKLRKQGKPTAPSYMLSNLGQNISSVKKRIEYLNKQSKIKRSSKTVKGIRIIQNPEINRIQLEFPNKPNEEIRSMLKHWGFRWSPREERWQRMLNNTGMYAAKMVIGKL